MNSMLGISMIWFIFSIKSSLSFSLSTCGKPSIKKKLWILWNWEFCEKNSLNGDPPSHFYEVLFFKSARMLWFSRQKCVYVMVFETKERLCCEFRDKSAYFVVFATKMRVCCDFHDNNSVFGISGSNSSVFQVFSAHTCTIHWVLPTKTVNRGLFRFERKKDFFEIR